MIYSIRGRLSHLNESTAVIEDQSGVSWEMEISARTRSELQQRSSDGNVLTVFTYLHHREDQMSLFGFSRPEEKDFFLLLNKVNGVGPRQSIKMLSAAAPESLADGILREDEGFLSSLPGIGIKGAKKIILSLKDKLSELGLERLAAEGGAAGVTAPGGTPDSAHLVEALVNMGFDRKDSRRAVGEVLRELPADASEGEVLRRAIVFLS